MFKKMFLCLKRENKEILLIKYECGKIIHNNAFVMLFLHHRYVVHMTMNGWKARV